MELIKLTAEELNTIRSYFESTQALNELVGLSVSNMEYNDLEIALDTILPLIKISMLSQHDFFRDLKEKYKLQDVFYCSKDGKVYGRL